VNVRRLDHFNCLSADIKADREFFQRTLGFRLTEQIVLDNGTEAGMWLTANAGARLVLAPDWKPITWTEMERKKGQAWGLKTIESFHTHGTPPLPPEHGRQDDSAKKGNAL
jgi:catechol 2,3-dioxygenase-like lactoylglutathione lyase family enzyme